MLSEFKEYSWFSIASKIENNTNFLLSSFWFGIWVLYHQGRTSLEYDSDHDNIYKCPEP